MTNLNPATQLQLMAGGYFLSRCLQVVAELGIADLISDSPISAVELAKSSGSDPDTLGRVISLLCAHGVFERVDGRFRHNACSLLLRTDHPMSMRSFARMFGVPILWEGVIRLGESVATGRPMANQISEGGFWQYLEQHPSASENFNQAMGAKSQVVTQLVTRSYDFSQFARIADVGGGHGHLLRAILNVSQTSRGIIFDQPHVIEKVDGSADGRLEAVGGDFFTDKMPEADAYVLMDIIHDWDDVHAKKILEAIRAAAPAAAKLLLVEAVMPEQPTPNWTATLDIVMLNLLGGKQRNVSQYRSLLGQCGFSSLRDIPVGAEYSILEATIG